MQCSNWVFRDALRFLLRQIEFNIGRCIHVGVQLTLALVFKKHKKEKEKDIANYYNRQIHINAKK